MIKSIILFNCLLADGWENGGSGYNRRYGTGLLFRRFFRWFVPDDDQIGEVGGDRD